MNSGRPAKLEFTDCRGCGKRVATTATLCRHCNTARLPNSHSDEFEEDTSLADSHAALNYGGYDDYDEEREAPENPKTMSRVWWWVAWVLIVFFLATTLVPWW